MGRKKIVPDSGRYFTGVSCPSGHVSERRASDRKCIECARSKSLIKMKEWRERNPERARATNRVVQAKRKAALLQRIPPWADLEKIAEFYRQCPEGHHVDHIVPLQGDEVCGFHVSENLQYLTASENLRKQNKWSSLADCNC